ncbi:universal stress protein [Streptomyces sp. NPDC003042]
MDTSRDQIPRVVVGVDGSPASYEALRWAIRHARLIGGKVDAVAAYDIPGAVGWSAPVVDADFDEGRAKQALSDEVKTVLVQAGDVPIQEHLVRGNPVEVLTESSADAELLVVGSRGWGGFARLLLGSVSQQCALHASCPVVIVRPPSNPPDRGTSPEETA